MSESTENSGTTEPVNDEMAMAAEMAALADMEVATAIDAGANTAAAEDDDPWAAALAEQQMAESAIMEEAEPSIPAAQPVDGSDRVFRPIEHEAGASTPRDLDIIMNIPVRLNVELGRTKISIKQLLELTQGSVLELDGLAGDPMDILINGYLIAQGEVVVVEDKYGIRITDIITPSERVQKLNR